MDKPQHIRAKEGEIAETVIISGDPSRVAQLSGLLRSRKVVNDYRGFLTYSGKYGGKTFTIACHGIGGPSAAIAVEELAMLGAKTIVRLGTCGGLKRQMKVGDLVIATGAGYLGGTLNHYFPNKKVTPKPDSGLTRLLAAEANGEGMKSYSGEVFSTDAFYTENRDFGTGPAAGSYIAVEMECATIFGVGNFRGIKTAGVLIVSDNVLQKVPMADAKALTGQVARTGKMVLECLAEAQSRVGHYAGRSPHSSQTAYGDQDRTRIHRNGFEPTWW